MKKETSEMRNLEEGAEKASATLPWWAVLSIAQHSGLRVPSHHLRHLHHCIHCDCVMICTDKACMDFLMSCPACSEKSKAVRTILVSKIALNENQGCPECSNSSTKKPISQGGN